MGKSSSVKFSRILGIEVVGTIDETSVPNQFPKGQTIASLMGGMGWAYNKSYAEYVLLPNQRIYLIQTQLS
ncbi:hypothetical protein HU830_02960 [Lactobacillus sp. DCY120]|uniref:Uncharacterized protein n=1 Tax=Bombilactobacillus apium TaxID=2675299 RepID=A0A850R680_9LACO|nr:hypothetical protein [Bombilactobacillus apium]NVY96142.1 hypothetical protein [Bombilactobacillus apium]